MTKPMRKRMWVEFLRYKWFPLLVAVLGLLLATAYFTVHNPGISPGKILGLCCFAMGFAGNYLGYYIQPYLADPYAAIVPGFQKAHIRFALSLNCFLAMLETGAMIAGAWQGISYLDVFAILWAFGSLWLGIACMGRASTFVGSFQELFWLFGPWIPLWNLMPSRVLDPLLSGFFYNTTAPATATLLIVGLTLNLFLSTKVLTSGKGRRSRSLLDREGSWESLGPVARKLFWNRTLTALDAIPQTAGEGFFSKVRVFRLTRQLLPRSIVFIMILAGVCLARFFGRQDFAATESPRLWGLYFAVVPLLLSGMLANGRMDLRLILRLPLRRSAAITAYGASALAFSLNLWITFIAAVFTGALLPFGLGLKEFPSLQFVVASFAVNLALFGITAVASSLQARVAVQALLGFLLLAALGITAALVPASFFPLASILLAMGLLLASYSLLCNAEMD